MALTFLLSHERSGSHLLAGYLSNFGITIGDEVCNNHERESPTNETQFSVFLEKRAESDRKFLYRTQQGMGGVLTEYFEFIDRYFGRDNNTLVDVKYGHLHNFNSFWTMPGWTPKLLEFIAERKIPLIHLYRRDLLATVISDKVAHIRESWNQTTADADQGSPTLQPITIEKKELFRWAWALATSIRNTRWILRFDSIRHLELQYEDIRPETITQDTADRITSFLGMGSTPLAAFKPTTVKMTRDKRHLVTNYEELHQLWNEQLQPLVETTLEVRDWVELAQANNII